MFDPSLKIRVVGECSTDNGKLPIVGTPYEDSETAVYQVQNNQVLTK